MTNKPYVKQYDFFGVLQNPIKGSYVSPYKNRETRRKENKELIAKPFSKDGMQIIGVSRWKQYVQIIGSKKIYHQILISRK